MNANPLDDHDRALTKNLSEASFVEDRDDSGCNIAFAHLTGKVWFSDGVMYWNAGDAGGEKRVDQNGIDRSAARLLNYGRKAVRNELSKTAKRVIASARARLSSRP